MALNSGDVLVYDGTNWVNSNYSRVTLAQAPAANDDYGLLNLGSGGFAGGGTNFAGHASGTFLAVNAASGYAGDWANFQLAGVSRFQVSNAGLTTCTYRDAGTSNTGYPLQLRHTTSASGGSIALGYGVGIQFMGQDSGGSNPEIGSIQCLESVPTAGSTFSTYMSFYVVMNNAASEVLRLRSTGTAPGQLSCRGDFQHIGNALGFYSAATVAQQTVTGSRGGNAALANLLTALNTLGLIVNSTT
jgi:hypothetical protein